MLSGSATSKYKRLPVLITGLFFALTAGAQIVNVESKRPGTSGEGWHGNVNLNLNYTRNVSNILSYGAKNMIQYKQERHTLLFLTDLSRIYAGGADFVNNGYEHLRYNYALGAKQRFAWEAFEQAQFNSVQKIAFRHLVGTGLRWNIYDADSLKFVTGSLPMFEYEELVDGSIERNIRESTYFLFFISMGGFEFQTINYYQPKINEVRDFRFSNSTTLEFGILRWLRYSVNLDLLYDSRVPAGVPNLVFTLKNGLSIEI